MDISPAYELRRDLASSTHDNPWAIRNPLDEARDLHRMTVYGSCTVESMRDLISVPPEIEAALLAYAEHYPKDGDRIRCVLRFRRKVGVEFEKLLRAICRLRIHEILIRMRAGLRKKFRVKSRASTNSTTLAQSNHEYLTHRR